MRKIQTHRLAKRDYDLPDGERDRLYLLLPMASVFVYRSICDILFPSVDPTELRSTIVGRQSEVGHTCSAIRCLSLVQSSRFAFCHTSLLESWISQILLTWAGFN